MALDPLEFAKVLERLRLSKGQSKEKAARFIGLGERQYRRLTSNDPPVPRLSTVEKVADAYGLDVGELLGEVVHANGSLTERLERLEELAAETQQAVEEILRLLSDEVLPALPAPQPSTAKPSAANTRTRRRQPRAS